MPEFEIADFAIIITSCVRNGDHFGDIIRGWIETKKRESLEKEKKQCERHAGKRDRITSLRESGTGFGLGLGGRHLTHFTRVDRTVIIFIFKNEQLHSQN